tara:strand:- start:2126 stop:2521 length:396 start_codon:yes stop_codon:yes gene_type:complete
MSSDWSEGAYSQKQIDYRHKKRDSSLDILSNKLENVRSTKVQEVLAIDYLGYEYHVSVKKWTFRKKGTNKWLKKNKAVAGLNTVIKFGKYKGHKIKEIKSADLLYLIWLGANTELVLGKKVTEDIDFEDLK